MYNDTYKLEIRIGIKLFILVINEGFQKISIFFFVADSQGEGVQMAAS